MSCSNPRQIRFVFNLVLLAALVAVRPVLGQQPGAATDETTVGVLAGLLAAADARRFDLVALREGLSHANPAVRRQGALAAGRIGDPAAVDLLLPVLNDSVPGAQAAAAFALGLLKDSRAIPLLLEKVRAVSSMEQGAPQLEAVTAIAKIGGDEGARALTDILAAGSPGGGAATPVVNAALLESWRLGPRAPVAELVRFTDAFDAATLRQRQSASLLTVIAAATPAPLSACATAMIACRLSAKTLLVSRGRSAASATAPRTTPNVVSAWTATPMSRSATSGTTAPASVESRNDASARRALMRIWASGSSSSRRNPATASRGSRRALSTNALPSPRAATLRVCASRSLSARISGAAPGAARKRASE